MRGETTLKLLLGAGVVMLCACATTEQRRDAEAAAVKKNVAEEIERICSLPEPQRDVELDKLKETTGLELYCAKPQ